MAAAYGVNRNQYSDGLGVYPSAAVLLSGGLYWLSLPVPVIVRTKTAGQFRPLLSSLLLKC